ncbi:MAG TPA: hypothetical protein VFV86_03845 [Nitrososphaeraceae archaeon]|nr:hypothetical protein [Nitrososphaeraceae archaeon]
MSIQKWTSTHSFVFQGLNECFIEDKIDYNPKFTLGIAINNNKNQD